MKKHTLIAIGIPLFLCLTSCGEKSKGEAVKEVSTQENTASLNNKAGGESAIKETLKSTVNGVTADLMLKVPGFLLLEKPVHDIPEDYAGRDLVQVSVKWPVMAKDDLYSYESVLAELPGKPVVVKKHYSKGDEVDHVSCTYVLSSGDDGSYSVRNSRFTKQGFNIPDVELRASLGKVTLVKGSDEHMEAAKQAAEIKRAEEEKTRLAELEDRKQKEVARQQALDCFKKHLAVKSAFKGDLKYDGELTTFLFGVTAIEEKAGESWFTIEIVERADKAGQAQYSAEYSGKLSSDGKKLELFPAQLNVRNSWRFMKYKSYKVSLALTGHEDKVLFEVDSIDAKERYHYSGEFLRMEP